VKKEENKEGDNRRRGRGKERVDTGDAKERVEGSRGKVKQ